MNQSRNQVPTKTPVGDLPPGFRWLEESERIPTGPIFRLVNDDIDFSGSGTLLHYGSRFFIITSAHVIDQVGGTRLFSEGVLQVSFYLIAPSPGTA